MMKKTCFFVLAVLVIGSFANEPMNRKRREAAEAISKAIASTDAAIKAMEAVRAVEASNDKLPIVGMADMIKPLGQHSLHKRQANDGLLDSSANLFGSLEDILKSLSEFLKPLMELFNSSAGDGEA